AFGLGVASALMWAAIEYKQYDKKEAFEYVMDVDDQLEEEVPMTEQLKTPPPPPPPPAAPEIIQAVEDEEEVEETIIESTETNQDEIVEVEELVEVEVPVDVDVPFTVIEDKPMFPQCEGVPNAEQFACFRENLVRLVREKFEYTEIAQDMGIQG